MTNNRSNKSILEINFSFESTRKCNIGVANRLNIAERLTLKCGCCMQERNCSHVKNRAYTRKEYARGFPPPKIVKFTLGDTKGTFAIEGRLVALERAQIRHSALEAMRVATKTILMDKLKIAASLTKNVR
jgi:hypothetical protein